MHQDDASWNWRVYSRFAVAYIAAESLSIHSDVAVYSPNCYCLGLGCTRARAQHQARRKSRDAQLLWILRQLLSISTGCSTLCIKKNSNIATTAAVANVYDWIEALPACSVATGTHRIHTRTTDAYPRLHLNVLILSLTIDCSPAMSLQHTHDHPK